MKYAIKVCVMLLRFVVMQSLVVGPVAAKEKKPGALPQQVTIETWTPPPVNRVQLPRRW